MLANKKCPHFCVRKREVTEVDVFKGSTILIPAGTKIEIFVNEDPNDPKSDVYPVEIITDNCYTAMVDDEISGTQVCY